MCELAAVSSIGNISGEPELGGWREAARGGEEQHWFACEKRIFSVKKETLTHKDAAPKEPRTAHHTPLVAVLQSAARARCTGPTCGRRYVRRGSTRGSAPTTSNAPPWHRGADDQAQYRG